MLSDDIKEELIKCVRPTGRRKPGAVTDLHEYAAVLTFGFSEYCPSPAVAERELVAIAEQYFKRFDTLSELLPHVSSLLLAVEDAADRAPTVAREKHWDDLAQVLRGVQRA